MRERQAVDLEAITFRAVMIGLAAIAILALVASTLIVLMTSVTSSPSLRFPPDGFSLRWYAALTDAFQMRQAAWNSLLVALLTTTVSVILGVAGALGIARNPSAWA